MELFPGKSYVYALAGTILLVTSGGQLAGAVVDSLNPWAPTDFSITDSGIRAALPDVGKYVAKGRYCGEWVMPVVGAAPFEMQITWGPAYSGTTDVTVHWPLDTRVYSGYVTQDPSNGLPMSVFPFVPGDPRAWYDVRIGNFHCTFEAPTMPEPPTDGATESSQSGKPCDTQVASGIMKDRIASKSDPPGGGNVIRTLVGINFNVYVTFGTTCGPRSHAPSFNGAGVAASLRGPNNPPMGGEFVNNFAFAFKGSGNLRDSDGSWSVVDVKPVIVLFKPEGGLVELRQAQLLGLNENSCASWPQALQDALALIPLSYEWSVVSYFTTRTYCTKQYTQLKSGPDLDRAYTGIWGQQTSSSTQKELGGRIILNAVAQGSYSMQTFLGGQVSVVANKYGSGASGYYDGVPGAVAKVSVTIV